MPEGIWANSVTVNTHSTFLVDQSLSKIDLELPSPIVIGYVKVTRLTPPAEAVISFLVFQILVVRIKK
jgi:hypothetical protein